LVDINSSEVDVKSILWRLRRSLIMPYSVVLVSIVCIFILVSYFTNSLNLYSISTEKKVFRNVYLKELESIGKVTKDYSFWNDAVEKVFLKPDPFFIKENFLGSYLPENFGISRVILLNPDLSINMSIHNGEVEVTATPYRVEENINELI